MSGFQINVTPEGRAALVNAQNTGTLPVLASQIGVSASATGLVGGALAGEIKRLATFSGDAVANDTIHVTIRDDSADTYSLRAFAIYFADGTLFAWYAQADVILEKSSLATLLLAADIVFADIDAAAITFGDSNWLNPPGTETVPGVVELATDAETATGTDNTRAVHPKGLKALLDSRFGAGAPSAFVKPLLALATGAAIRLALELKGAALKDEGAGNGLDADLLDGQHGAWYRNYANLSNVPGAFPPSPHPHVWANISDPPSTATRWPTYAEVADKPATFPPSPHPHAIADVQNLSTELAGKALANHNHVPLDAGGRLNGMAATVTDWNNAAENGWYMGSGAANAPDAGSWWIGDVVQHNPNWITQTVWQFSSNFRAIYRRQKVNGTWSAWERCRWHESEQDARYLQLTGASPMTGVLKSYTGAVGSQAIMREYGWNNSVSRVKSVLETDGSFSLYAYDTAGNTPTRLCNFSSPVTGASVTTATFHVIRGQDIYADRGNGTGVIFLNGGGTRYLHYDGTLYNLPGAGVLTTVAGGYTPGIPDAAGLQTSGSYGGGLTLRDGSWRASMWTASGNSVMIGIGTTSSMPAQLTITTSGTSAVGGFQPASSRELKNIDGPLPYGLAELLRVEAVIGSYKSEYCDDGGRKRYFVVAEQLRDILPEPVFEDRIEFEGKLLPAVDYDQLVPVLVRAVQELAVQIRELRAGE